MVGLAEALQQQVRLPSSLDKKCRLAGRKSGTGRRVVHIEHVVFAYNAIIENFLEASNCLRKLRSVQLLAVISPLVEQVGLLTSNRPGELIHNPCVLAADGHRQLVALRLTKLIRYGLPLRVGLRCR
ncbi:hypothetical protein D3C71_1829750 [compost metagenome]